MNDPRTDWTPITDCLPANGLPVLTRIDDGHGIRNEQVLVRHDRLWFLEDHSMYVYYTPTHWRYRPAEVPY